MSIRKFWSDCIGCLSLSGSYSDYLDCYTRSGQPQEITSSQSNTQEGSSTGNKKRESGRLQKKETRRDQLICLVLGLKESGKTAAIENLLGPSLPFLTNGITEVASLNLKLKVVKAPGFFSRINPEMNASILAMHKVYLESHYSIPAITIITARLTDNRFAGEYSDFTLFLKGLKYFKNSWADDSFTNVVLLLTNGDSADIQDTKHKRVAEYKNVFQNVFGADPICIVMGENKLSIREIDEQLKNDIKHDDLESREKLLKVFKHFQTTKSHEWKPSHVQLDNLNADSEYTTYFNEILSELKNHLFAEYGRAQRPIVDGDCNSEENTKL